MNGFPERKIVDAVKAAYPAGCTVVLDYMDDQYREMPAGLKGTVSVVDDIATVHVNWENGSTLGVAYGVDRIHRVYSNTRIQYLYRDASNFKTQNEVVIKGQITRDQAKEILSCCEGGEFIPEQIDWPLERGWDISEDDHCFAELEDHSFEPTDSPATVDMTAEQVMEAFRAAKGNWDAARYAPEID